MPDDQNTRSRDFQNCIKKLECLYDISVIAAKPHAPLNQIMQEIADRIPFAFKQPEHVCTRIKIGQDLLQTANFTPCPWRIDTDITVDGKVVGILEVGYVGDVSHDASPFHKEEKEFLPIIAGHLGLAVSTVTLRRELEQSEKQYRALVDNALVGFTQSNLKGELLYANTISLRMFGYESLEEAMAASTINRYRNLEDRKALLEILKQTGKIADFEVEFMSKTGDPISILLSAALEGDVITGMMIDNRSRQSMESALIKSEDTLAKAQRIAHVGSWEWDIITGELRWSDETYRIFGFLPQKFSVTYEAFLACIHADDRPAVNDALNQSLSDPNRPYSIEHRVVRSDGTKRVVHERGEVTFDANGIPVRMMGTVHDVTERKRAEGEIRKLKDRLEAENIYLREEIKAKESYGDIIGTSDTIRYALNRTRLAARTKTTVLLTGETGTGKGIFARFLHQESDRSNKPFVNVNCAGLPANLIESELFGREKGAFTGSSARQIGRFELANGGTIFLDEIGELPFELQAKLLKVIEEGEFERLGSPHPVKVDVRIVASTNRNLKEEIKNGRFREDLYFRLSVFPVSIPPLRERKGDIPLLVNAYTAKFCRSYKKDIQKFSTKVMESFENYTWPGNVRELINVIERAVIVSDGLELMLAEKIQDFPIEAAPAYTAVEEDEVSYRKYRAAIDRKEQILSTLGITGWRVEGPRGAAALLGVNPSTLRTRMKKLGIVRPGSQK